MLYICITCEMPRLSHPPSPPHFCVLENFNGIAFRENCSWHLCDKKEKNKFSKGRRIFFSDFYLPHFYLIVSTHFYLKVFMYGKIWSVVTLLCNLYSFGICAVSLLRKIVFFSVCVLILIYVYAYLCYADIIPFRLLFCVLGCRTS